MNHFKTFYETIINKNGQNPPYESLSKSEISGYKRTTAYRHFSLNEKVLRLSAQLHHISLKMQRTIDLIQKYNSQDN